MQISTSVNRAQLIDIKNTSLREPALEIPIATLRVSGNDAGVTPVLEAARHNG